MKNLAEFGTFVVTLFILNVNGQNSPCPTVFQYQQDGNKKYGIITIPGPGEGKTVVNAAIGIYGQVYNSNSGGIKLRKKLESAVEDAKRGLDVQYTFDFPQSEQWPVISKIDLNYQTICNGQATSNAPTWKYEHSFTYPSGSQQLSVPNQRPPQSQNSGLNFFACFPNCDALQPQNSGQNSNNTPFIPNVPTPIPPPMPPAPTPAPNPPTPIPNPPISSRPASSGGNAQPDSPAWLNNFKYKATCGIRDNFTPSAALVPTELIIGGEPVEIGEYPWMVAMFLFKRRRMIYACGATLVTDKHAITAAHCTKNEQRVQLEFGKHDLSKNNDAGALTRISNDIIEHPEYVANQAHADIAIVSFDALELSNTIKPICIWQFGTNFDSIKKKGIITGWGQVEQGGDSSEIPNQLQIERTDIQKCRDSHVLLQSLATDKTFCAGGESKGPCHGDSGSGFYINHGKKFYLRGIISTSVGTATACHIDKYAVYADVIYFLEWIKNNIS